MAIRTSESSLMTSLRRAVGSLLAALGGWLTGTALVAINQIVLLSFHGTSWQESYSGLRAHFILIGGFVAPIWLVILLPIYVLLRRTSPLWRVPICTILGACTGAAIVMVYLVTSGGFVALLHLWFFLLEGAVVGAATCFFGSTTAKYFDGVMRNGKWGRV